MSRPSPGLVRMLGRPGDGPMLLLRKQPNGDFLVLELKPGPDAWAEGDAMAATLNAACTEISTRRSTADDCTIDRLTGPRPIETGEVRYASPPGRDDVSPDVIEIYGGPGSGDLADWVIRVEIAHSVSWPDGQEIVRRLRGLANRLALVPGRHRMTRT